MSTAIADFDPFRVLAFGGVLVAGAFAAWLVPWFLQLVFRAVGLEYSFDRSDVLVYAQQRARSRLGSAGGLHRAYGAAQPVTAGTPAHRFYRSDLGFVKTNGFAVFYLLLRLAIGFGTFALVALTVRTDFIATVASITVFGWLSFMAVQNNVRNIHNGFAFRMQGHLRLGDEIEVPGASGYLVAFHLENVVLVDSAAAAECYLEDDAERSPWGNCKEHVVSYNTLRDFPYSRRAL